LESVLFFLAAIGALVGAVGVIGFPKPFYSVLALVVHLIALAVLFLLLSAEFIAAAQVIVYAGAVMVLYVFVVAYVGGQDQPLTGHHGPGMRAVALVFAGALLVEFAIAIIGSGLSVLDEEGTGFFPGFGSPAEMGRLFLTKFLLAFEIASLLLLVAAVGAVILARRRSGLGDTREVSVKEFLGREELTKGKGETGTMIETGGPRDI